MGNPHRRILFIEKGFQLKFILKVIGVIVLGTGLTAACLYLFGNYKFEAMTYSMSRHEMVQSWEVFRSAVLIASAISMALVAGLAVMFALRDSHKIGGPLFRFRQNLLEIGRGNLTLHTKLRDGDELRAFVDSMNEMTTSLHDKVKAVRSSQEALVAELGKAGEKDPAAVIAAISPIVQAMGDALDGFQVRP